MPIGAAIGAVSVGASIYGNEEQKKAQKKGKKNLEGYVSEYSSAQLGNIEQGLGEQERLLKQANREELAGGEDAIKRYEGAGSQAIQDQSQQALGGITAGASERGLLGSSVEGNARLGVARAASRSYLTLGETVSNLRQGLAQRRAAATNRLGALRAYRSQAKNNVLAQGFGALAGYQANTQYTAQQPNFGGLGALGGYALGGGFSGGGGGGDFTPYASSEQLHYGQSVS